MLRLAWWLFFLSCFSRTAVAQWTPQDAGTLASLRAVCAVNEQVCWLGGSMNTLRRTTDGGKTWLAFPVPGADSLDFRDVHAFSAETAVVLSAGEATKGKARLYRTTNGGKTWKLVYQTTQAGAFLDGLDFWDDRHGLCFGDPVDDHFFILATDDGGQTWQELPRTQFPAILPKEGAFAASGTSLVVLKGSQSAWICTGGGPHARVLSTHDRGRHWQAVETPLPAGTTTGLFGLRFWSEKDGMAVGGDYKNGQAPAPNLLVTSDGGLTWRVGTSVAPDGLKEAIVRLRAGAVLVAVGPSGAGISTDGGKTWKASNPSAFHAISAVGNTAWAVGSSGVVARFDARP